MQTCTNCGHMFEGYACPSCGVIPQQGQQPYYDQQAAQQPPAYGPQGYQAPPQYYQPQDQYPQPVYAPMPPAPPKSSPMKAIIAVVVVIVIIIAAIAAAIIFLAVTNPFNDAKEIFDGETIDGELLEAGSDVFYKIKLGPGEVVHASLSGLGGTDFDLYAYENVLFWDEYIITGSATDTSYEALEFVAWQDDFYIIDVYSYSGTGDYTLTVDIINTISLDDGDNSLVEAYPMDSGETISDSLNEYYDRDDYYSIFANQGQILYVFLEVPVQVKTDFDLYIFDSSGNQLAVSEAAYGNEQLTLYAENSGNYYLNVWAYSGIGVYSIYAEVTSGPGADYNNDLSSAESTYDGAYFSSTISQYDDEDDFYSIYLSAGQTLTVGMTGPADADFDLYLYDDSGDIVASSGEYTSSETIVYTAPIGGTYYINPYAYAGFGTYYLSVSTGSGSALNADAGSDRTIGTGQTITFDGRDSQGAITSYSWNFGDGETGSGSTVTHSYGSTGTYTATLTVSDGTNTDSDSVTVTVAEAGTMPGKYALVIGISDYQGDNDLNYCDEDADSWTAYLEGQGYTVRTLIDSAASASEIMDNIQWLEDQEQAGDYVAFVFSGHGSYSDRTRSSYICAWNIEEQDGFVSDQQIGDAFENFDSQHIFFFFDSCHSGGMDSVAGPGRYVSQTAGQLEYGLDAPKHEHGMWTYWFLEYAINDRGNSDLTSAFTVAYPQAVADAAEGGNSMHPEQEFTGSSFYL